MTFVKIDHFANNRNETCVTKLIYIAKEEQNDPIHTYTRQQDDRILGTREMCVYGQKDDEKDQSSTYTNSPDLDNSFLL